MLSMLVLMLQFIIAAVLTLAGCAARDNEKTVIIPRWPFIVGQRNEEELKKLLSGIA